MTEAEWLACTDPEEMVEVVRGRGASERKLRLFAAACCRRIWDRLPGEEARLAVWVAEEYADGRCSIDRLREAHSRVEMRLPSEGDERQLAAETAALEVSWDGDDLSVPGQNFALFAAYHAANAGEERSLELEAQRVFVLDIFGNPFRHPAVAPALLAWQDGIIPKLAYSAYEHRRLPEGTLDNARLAVLADALEEAGCTDPSILDHLRGPGPHTRGCWVVDSLTGKS